MDLTEVKNWLSQDLQKEVKAMQRNINVVAEVRELLTEYASEAGIYISGYDCLVVTGQVTIDKNLDINLSYDNVSHNARIRVMYNTEKYEIDVHVIGDEPNYTDFSEFCDILINIIILYKREDKREFIRFLFDL